MDNSKQVFDDALEEFDEELEDFDDELEDFDDEKKEGGAEADNSGNAGKGAVFGEAGPEYVSCPFCGADQIISDPSLKKIVCYSCKETFNTDGTADEKPEPAPVPKPQQENKKAGSVFSRIDDNIAAIEEKMISKAVSERNKAWRSASFNNETTENEISVFADGLPKWDLEPPELFVNRRGAK